MLIYLGCARLLGLTESFYDEIKTLPLDGSAPEEITSFNNADSGAKKFNKRKVWPCDFIFTCLFMDSEMSASLPFVFVVILFQGD